jgi:hypothetical protein
MARSIWTGVICTAVRCNRLMITRARTVDFVHSWGEYSQAATAVRGPRLRTPGASGMPRAR